MKVFLLSVICFSLLLFTAGCSRHESLASTSLNPVFDGQAFVADGSVRIEGKPITQSEILELIERSRSHWLKLIEQDPSFQGAKDIRVSKYGYSLLNYEERLIKRDLVQLPIFRDDKLVAIATAFRDGGQLSASVTGPGQFERFNAAMAAHPGEKLACVFAGHFTECLITPDNQIITWNGNPPELRNPVDWHRVFMTEHNALSVDFDNEEDFISLKASS